MQLDEIIQRARELAQAYRITKGDTFRLKDIDPEDTAGLEAEDKPRAQEGLQAGVQALHLMVAPSNHRAHHVYYRAGFRASPRLFLTKLLCD